MVISYTLPGVAGVRDLLAKVPSRDKGTDAWIFEMSYTDSVRGKFGEVYGVYLANANINGPIAVLSNRRR